MRIAALSGLLATSLFTFPACLAGQDRLVDPRLASAGVTWQRWSYSTPLDAAPLAVSVVSQISVPVAVSFTPVRNWQIDVAAAFARGTVRTTSPDGDATMTLTGATDARVRAVGRLAGDAFWLTLGVGVPSGRAQLDDDEATALRVIGAPALRMATPVLGSGAGFTVGGVFTPTIGPWAIGVGVSYERRAGYSPLEASLASGGSLTTELEPGDVVHASLGFDRIVGRGRLSILFSADRYGTDVVTLAPTGAAAIETTYRLGPTMSASWQYETTSRSLRDLRIHAIQRYRAAFQDSAGTAVAGSSGFYADAGIAATFGRPRGICIIVALDGALDSGLDVDDSLTTAAMTGGSLTLGIDVRVGQLALRPFMRGSMHSIEPGTTAATGTGITAGITLQTQW